MGCATVTPLYETAQIKKGFDGGMGIAYQWGNYNEDSIGYRYNYLRADFLFEYGFTENISFGTKIFGAIGKEKRYDKGKTSCHEEYGGWFVSSKISFLNISRVSSGVVIDVGQSGDPTNIVGYFTPLVSVKDKNGVDIFTVGTRFFYPFGSDYNVLLLKDLLFVITPNLQNKDNLHVFFGIGILPLWWERWEQEFSPHNFAVGIGFK